MLRHLYTKSPNILILFFLQRTFIFKSVPPNIYWHKCNAKVQLFQIKLIFLLKPVRRGTDQRGEFRLLPLDRRNCDKKREQLSSGEIPLSRPRTEGLARRPWTRRRAIKVRERTFDGRKKHPRKKKPLLRGLQKRSLYQRPIASMS